MSFPEPENQMPESNQFERRHDAQLLEKFSAAGVRSRPLLRDEHQQQESAWRAIYGKAFVPRLRHRHGAKAVNEFVRETPEQWLLVPFLAPVPGTPVSPSSRRQRFLSAFECCGPLLELGEFCGDEFFIAPLDFSWTFIATHEDYSLGGPYFVRQEWLPDTAMGNS
jgi:hypothetical protein